MSRREALVGPFYFGRAFDAPPRFTVSAVGASPRDTPAGLDTPCLDSLDCNDAPVLKGNVAVDGSFETVKGSMGDNPFGDEDITTVDTLPRWGGVVLPLGSWWIDTGPGAGTDIPGPYLPAYNIGDLVEMQFDVSTANPRTGNYALRWSITRTSSSVLSAGLGLYLMGRRVCDTTGATAAGRAAAVVAVEAGDTITPSFYLARALNVASLRLSMAVTIFDKAAFLWDDEVLLLNNVSTSAGYEQFSHEFVAPVSGFLQVLIQLSGSTIGFGGGSITVDVDDYSLVVA